MLVTRRVCQVCGAPTNYAHFGIDSCRACAEFYKRTITTNKNYACRQGNRNCRISKTERFICRRCRFEKCRELGMTLEDGRRRKRSEDSLRVSVEDPGPSIYSGPPSLTHEESIIDKITREHNMAMARRKEIELSTRAAKLRQQVRVAHPTEDIMMCTWSYLMNCLKSYANDYMKISPACFPEVEQLSLIEKLMLLKSCAVRLYLAEAAYYSVKTFGTGEGPMYMLTLTSCIDRNNLKFLIKDSMPNARHESIVNSLAYCLDRLVKIAWPAFEKMDLTDTEFHALLGLVHWQIDPSQLLPDRLLETAAKYRQEIYAALRRYYREELKLTDYSVRMGNLMTLEHIVQEGNSLMIEDTQTFNLLDMLNADLAFLKIVLQIKL